MTTTQMLCGMGETHVVKGPVLHTCLGLGSCIGIAAMDSAAQVSAMVHVMLPEAFKDKPIELPGKYADVGIKFLLEQMEAAGAMRTRIIVGYAGGAQVFKFGGGGTNRMDVGARNATAVADQLKKHGIRVLATDVGGSNGRTVTFDGLTGEVRVRTVLGGEKALCNLTRK